MTKYYLVKLFCLSLITLFVSCSSDDNESNCLEQLGELETVINDQTLFQARWTVFEFFENGALSVDGIAVDQNCLPTAIMSLTGEPNLDRQEFVLTTPQFIRESTNITFSQISDDVFLGTWQIVEGEANWVQFSEITETSIKGNLQATLVPDETGNIFQTLPDTLRLTNVSFEAVQSELLNGSN